MAESISNALIEKLLTLNNELSIQNHDLKLANNFSQKEAEKLNFHYNFSPVPSFNIDCQGKIIKVNISAAKFFDLTQNEIIDSELGEFLTKNNLLKINEYLLNSKESNAEQYCSIEMGLIKSKRSIVHLRAIFFKEEQQYIITITEGNKKESLKSKLVKNEFIFKEIQRIGHIGSYKLNVLAEILELSEESYFLFGIENKKKLNFDSWFNLIDPRDRIMMKEYLTNCLVNHIPFRKEYRIIRKNDNQSRWLDGWGEIIFDDEKNEFLLIGVIQDITERKLSLEKIKNSEIRSHRIFESSKEGILILDAITGQITDANPFLIELIGFNYQELVGKELWEIGVFKNIAASKEAFIELQNKEYIRFEDMPLETKAGKLIDVEIVSNVYKVEQKNVILCHIRDISDRKKVDVALQESSQLYFAMFEKNHAPMLLINPIDGDIIDANTAAARFYGYSLEEFKAMNLSDISTFPPEEIMQQMKKFAPAGQSYFQFVHKLASGETCDIEIYTSPLFINGQALLISTINDIKKRKLEEERLVQLNHQLKEVNILKSQFISTVSHEFRTPLAGILSSVQLLKIYNDTWDKEKKEKMFKQIFDAVQHTKALLDDVSLIDEEQTSKSFFRPINTELIPLINEIIEENISVSGTNQKIVVKSNLIGNSYYMDPIMIRHIFNNIISNAIKYSSENKKITIKLDETSSKEIKFVIKDKGIGIPQEEIKYLLEPFYRASNRGAVKGTGFGLSIVKRFIDLHKGQIVIESDVNIGTKVFVVLPYFQEQDISNDKLRDVSN